MEVGSSGLAVEQGIDGVGSADGGFPHLGSFLLEEPATQAAVEGAVIGGQLADSLHRSGVDDDLMPRGCEAAAGIVEEGAVVGSGGQVLLHGIEVEAGLLVASGGVEDDGCHRALVVAHAGNRTFQVVKEIAHISLLALREFDASALGDVDVVEVHERTRLDGRSLGLSLLHLLNTLGIGLCHVIHSTSEEVPELLASL